MKLLTLRPFWGLALIAGGIVFFLQSIGLLLDVGWLWGAALAAGGLVFLSVYVENRANWWGLIPGTILLGVSTVIFLSYLDSEYGAELGGVIVLGSIGLAFLFVYLANRDNWWALIPMGVLLSLALTFGLIPLFARSDGFLGRLWSSETTVAGLFFLGLGLTFGLVGVAPNPHGQMRWAFIPSGILLLLSLGALAFGMQNVGAVLSIGIILAGIFLIYRAVKR